MKIIVKINKPKLNLTMLKKAYTEGIYCDSPANRKLGRVGMTYAAYAEKIKDEEEAKNPNKKEFLFTFQGGDTIMLNDGKPLSEKRAIEEASKMVKENLENDPTSNKITYDLEENTNDWTNEQINKGYISYQVSAERNGKNIDVIVIDLSTAEGHDYFSYIRNDKQAREDKKADARLKYKLNKLNKEREALIKFFEEVKEYQNKDKKQESKQLFGGAKNEAEAKVYKRIDKYFGFESNNGEFVNAPITSTYADVNEVCDLIDRYTDWETIAGEQSGNRDIGYSISIYPKYTLDSDIDLFKKTINIELNKTSTKDLIRELGIKN